MKKILLSFLALLTTVSVLAQAGLTQGEAYVNPTPTPQQAKKYCPHCGITKGNITYPWQHESWCPYYRSQSSGSSSSSGRSSSSGSGVSFGAKIKDFFHSKAGKWTAGIVGAAALLGIGYTGYKKGMFSTKYDDKKEDDQKPSLSEVA
jgi:hypothetical protein